MSSGDVVVLHGRHGQEHSEVLMDAGHLDRSALADSSARYSSMFTHHPLAAYSVDCNGYFTDANARALEMAGLTLQEMRGKHFADIIHPDTLPAIQDGFARTMAGEPQLVDACVLRTDGQVVDIRCTAIPVIVDGQVVGVHGVTEDITEANRLLRELEAANTAKTLFLATVSHEVRTPLAALVGATELLMDSDLDPEPAHYAKIVHRSSERLMQLVHDILEYSGLEAHQAVLHLGPFDLRTAVEDIADWATASAAGRDVAVTVDVDDSVPAAAVADGRRVVQVVTNLVQNAIKFTEHGTVGLRVTAAGPSPGDDNDERTWVEFTVTDTGIGIAEEQLASIFQPFMQADPHTSGDRQGSGLGLAICRELVDLMGGELDVASVPGEGSTFTFGVPLRRCPDGSVAPSVGG
jgi:PAS domain S-box-containing protein